MVFVPVSGGAWLARASMCGSSIRHAGQPICALLIGGVVGRPRMGWALWAGTVLQALVIAAGVVVPAMYVLGVIFAVLWVTGIWLVRRHETPHPHSPAP